MDWALTKLERRIKLYARGQKVYKSGDEGDIVERFKYIILSWEESGSNTRYNKLLHCMPFVNTSGKSGAQIPQLPLGEGSPPWGR
jgi:hypothetical protein